MQCFSLETGVLTTPLPLNITSSYNKGISYIPYTGRLLEHILRTTTLTSNEKLFYILADGLSLISGNSNTKQRAVVLPGATWADKLNCSKREVFSLQKSLEEKGYFIIIRDTNKCGKNKRNVIIPTVPDSVFYFLDKEVDRYNSSSETRPNLSILTPIPKTTTSSAVYEHTQKRSYLDKTKLYIPINYHILSVVLASSKLNTFSKVLWLDFYNKCYQNHRKSKSQTCNKHLNDYFSFICSYKELENQYSCKKSWLSKTLKSLEDFGFITRSSLYIKNDDIKDNLHDKSLWNITVTISEEYLKLQKQLEVTEEDENEKDTEVIGEENSDATTERNRGVSYFPPYISDNALLLNKCSLINIKNIDNKDTADNIFNSSISLSHLSTFLKKNNDKKNYYSNPIGNNSTTTLDKAKTSSLSKRGKIFKDFYPLSQEQVGILNSKSGKEFNLNFGNQLLLKLSRDTSKVFLSYNQFIAYMTTAFAREKRPVAEVNNPNFRLKVNLTKEALVRNNIEEYLTQVELSSDTSYEAQLRKKIAGSFDYNLAYQLLTQGKFEYIESMGEGCVKSFRVSLPPSLELTLQQEATLEARIGSVYGEIIVFYETIKNTGNKSISVNSDIVAIEEIEEVDHNSTWGKIRENLREELGENIDRAWFSKLKAEEDNDANVISLIAPTNFIRDMINQRYGRVIRQYTGELGYQFTNLTSSPR